MEHIFSFSTITLYYIFVTCVGSTSYEKILSARIGETTNFECGSVSKLSNDPLPFLVINGTFYYWKNLESDITFSIVDDSYSFSLSNVQPWRNNTHFYCYFPRTNISTITTTLIVDFRKFLSCVHHYYLC